MKRFKLSLLLIFVSAISLPILVVAQRRGVFWPMKEGVYIATSSQAIPQFPRSLSGFRATGSRDYWGQPFKLHGSIRVGEGNDWEPIFEFPHTMNSCSAGVFMIRWRSANPDVRIASALGYSSMNEVYTQKTGTFGYMQGHNCEEPLFKFAGTRNRNESNLADVYYEIKFWRAAP